MAASAIGLSIKQLKPIQADNSRNSRFFIKGIQYDFSDNTSGYAIRGSRPGVQSASLYDNFGKPGNYVIMTSLMTS